MGVAERKLREKKQRAEMILDAAEAVFFARGFDSSTMDDVANEAELSKGCVYNYFASKNELCIGIVNRGVGHVKRMMQERISEISGNALEKFTAATIAYADFAWEYPKYYCALQTYRHHRGGCGADSSYLNRVIDDNNAITGIIAGLIREGQESGCVRNDIDPEETATVLWGDYAGALPGFILNGSNSVPLYMKVVELIIDGLKQH